MSGPDCKGGIGVAVVGLGFGAEFVPISIDHPDVARVAVCDVEELKILFRPV